jgi:uncharacterized protein with HEPN domain
MSERDITLYIVDILLAISKIERYTDQFNNAEEFLHSELEWDASIRELQIIGDATSVILKHQLIDNSYRRIVDFRNQITHGYFGIDEQIVWDVITKKIQQFKIDLMEVTRLNRINLTNAIESAIKENYYNEKAVTFLSELKNALS